MEKLKSFFQCSNCGARFPRWIGRCTSCGEWNTIEEVIYSRKLEKATNHKHSELPLLIPLNDITVESNVRIPTNINEFDRVIGGGFVPGSVVLISGEPGIGKSTLLLQVLNAIDSECVFISGEESYEQIKLRAKRINVKSQKIKILCETNLETISNVIEVEKSNFIAIDSIQTIVSGSNALTPGSLFQIRETSIHLTEIAKKTNKIIVLIGHINKEGNIAGPKVLEHIVDCVLTLEGERNSELRLLRSLKNRFGSTNEIGLFEMSHQGLLEIKEPTKVLLSNISINNPGIAFSSFVEGARCFVVEIQSLVTLASYNIPQRNVNGYDFKRVQMILSVLDKKLNLNFRQNDVFVNITGGIFIDDTSIDLAIAASLFSSLNDIAIPKEFAMIGEIGLTEEVRNVQHIDKRIKELVKLGFKNIILPKSSKSEDLKKLNAKLYFVNKVSEAFNIIFG